MEELALKSHRGTSMLQFRNSSTSPRKGKCEIVKPLLTFFLEELMYTMCPGCTASWSRYVKEGTRSVLKEGTWGCFSGE